MRLLLFISLLFHSICWSQDFEYASIGFESAPSTTQKVLDDFFRTNNFLSFKQNDEFQDFGLNQIYFTHDFNSFVSMKYDVKGNFPLGQILQVEGGELVHLKYDNVIIAYYFINVPTSSVRHLIPALKELSLVPKSSLLERLLPIEAAHAEENCDLPISTLSKSSTTSTMASVAASTVISALSSCLSGASEEAKSASGFNFAKSVSAEAGRLWNNPGKRLNEYWGSAKNVALRLGGLVYAIGDAIIHPQDAIKKLGSVLGETGRMLGAIIGVMAQIPSAAVSMVCSLVTGIGIRSLLAAISGGAAAVLLATKLGRIIEFLGTIRDLVDKMKVLGLTKLEHLGLSTDSFAKIFSKLSAGTLEGKKLAVFVDVLDEPSELAKTMARRGLQCAL